MNALEEFCFSKVFFHDCVVKLPQPWFMRLVSCFSWGGVVFNQNLKGHNYQKVNYVSSDLQLLQSTLVDWEFGRIQFYGHCRSSCQSTARRKAAVVSAFSMKQRCAADAIQRTQVNRTARTFFSSFTEAINPLRLNEKHAQKLSRGHGRFSWTGTERVDLAGETGGRYPGSCLSSTALFFLKGSCAGKKWPSDFVLRNDS